MRAGSWSHGVYDGSGSLSYASGDTYTGTFRAGKPHGHGVYTNNTTGEIVRSFVMLSLCRLVCFCRLFTQTLFARAVFQQYSFDLIVRLQYEGDWVQGERHGHGTWHIHSAAKFVGVFEHDLPVGRGRYIFGSHEVPGEYGSVKVQPAPPARFKTVKAGEDEDEAAAAAAKKKKKLKLKPAPQRALVSAHGFVGDSYKGVHVCM